MSKQLLKVKAYARWSRIHSNYMVTKWTGDVCDACHWHEFLTETELQAEIEEGLEVEYYE